MVGRVKRDCKKCVRSEEARKEWGCDAPLASPWVWSTCGQCQGYDPSCPRCKGDLKGVPQYRCPNSMVGADMARAIQFFGSWKLGVMPDGGAPLDQPTTFIATMRALEGFVEENLEEMRKQAAEG